MEEQIMQQQEQTEEIKDKKNKKRRKTGRGTTILCMLQHLCLVIAVVNLVSVILGSYVFVDTKDETKVFHLSNENQETSFEDSLMFNSLLGDSISDIICYGAIRGQLETDGKFDAKKKIDVTAFVNRYNGVPSEYITANYYLDDLIKWAQYGFQYEDVHMSGEEVKDFLSDSRVVTMIDLKNYSGGTISYMNSDLSKATRVVDVSGNLLERGDVEREDANANILNNRYHTAEGKDIENYVSNWEEYYELCANVKKAAEDLNINYTEYLKYKDYYAAEKTNIVYFIKRTVGDDTQIFTNLDTEQTQTAALISELKQKCRKYVYYDPMSMQFDTNTMIEEATLRYILNGYEYAYPEDTQIMIGVRTTYPAMDAFNQGKNEFRSYVPYVWQYTVTGLVCVIVYLILLVILTMHEGETHKKETGEIVIRLHREDRIPTEVMMLLAGVAGFVIFWCVSIAISHVWKVMDDFSLLIGTGAFALLVSMMFSFFYYSFIRRIKAKTIWKNSLIRRMCLWIKKCILYFYDHSTVILRVWIPFVLFVAVNIGTILLTGFEFGIRGFLLALILLIMADGAVGWILYRSALSRQLILEGIELIREGNLDHKVEENGMHGDNLVLAKAVNSIGDSVKNAVETSMRDERLKADLITNVSHDIKTPLTSIINYVDLIKRENVQDSKVREYIEVLDAKSQRLKQLTDDLVEASKISSGNIVLSWEKINLIELLNQTIGELSEKFEEKSLTPVVHAPKGSICIEADSRRIWRVIENLFNNIFKYALPGTRVYIEVAMIENKETGRQVSLSIKNISAQPLKVNPDELTERFIRGDESRSTEGSGLGLSIAKNLTEAQKGKFEIVMDGDLFKVNLVFPLLENEK